jgi:RNA polymerase sigma factor (sigma-70 family)
LTGEPAGARPKEAQDSTDLSLGAERALCVEPETFRRFQEGDPDAACRVVEAFHKRLVGFLYMRVRHRETAEELAQEVFLAAYRQRRDIRDAASLRPWLFTVATRKAMKETAKRRRRPEIAAEEEALAALAPAEEPAQGRGTLAAQSRALLEEAMEGLDEAERELVTLRFFGELPIKEISAALDMPMGTVGVKLGRTLKKIRVHLEGKGLRLEDFVS